jgi:hypothetical protein
MDGRAAGRTNRRLSAWLARAPALSLDGAVHYHAGLDKGLRRCSIDATIKPLALIAGLA